MVSPRFFNPAPLPEPLKDEHRAVSDEEARSALREFFEAVGVQGGTELNRVFQAFVDSHKKPPPAEIDWSDKSADGNRNNDSEMKVIRARIGSTE